MPLVQGNQSENISQADFCVSALNSLPTQSQKQQIFLVDDTLANIKFVSEFLIGQGYEVLVAKSGKQALTKLSKASPDLILLDVVMPEMDGFETCRRLKAWEKTKDIPVIFMTAVADSSNSTEKVKGLALGAVDFISKPIQLEEVLARIKIHLHLRSLTKQLQGQNTRLQMEICDRIQTEKALRESEAREREKAKELEIALDKLSRGRDWG